MPLFCLENNPWAVHGVVLDCFAYGTLVFTRKMQRVCDKDLYTAPPSRDRASCKAQAYQKENNLDICIRLATFVLVNTILQSELFVSWRARLEDMQAKFRILARIRRAELGNFGDCKSVGGGVSEMRVHTGKGYRMYFMQDGDRVYILLAGGDKSSQQKDIEVAIALAKERKALL